MYVQIAYPYRLLKSKGLRVHSPTVLDLFASFENVGDSWVFQKNRNPGGGPDWGFALDLSGSEAGGRGMPEAVHMPFRVERGERVSLRLSVLFPSDVDCGKVLKNLEI